MSKYRSHGTGLFELSQFAQLGKGVVFEAGVLVFHPENIEIGDDVYVGHQTILKGYYKNKLSVGSGTWVGPQCFLHGAGGLCIGKDVGIGPGVKMITSYHGDHGLDQAIMSNPLEFSAISIGDDSDIGINATILPGVSIGRGVQVGAGAVVTENMPDYSVVVGVPARVIRMRRS
jgi:acetyltransferase-like isoleucine patch superfamily enzyme